jgi:hypothetical protein
MLLPMIRVPKFDNIPAGHPACLEPIDYGYAALAAQADLTSVSA